MSELERIGRLMLYRNKILEKLLREISKDFPNMEIVLEEFERLLEAIDDLDDETIHTIARLKESKSVVAVADGEDGGEVVEKDDRSEERVSFEDWFVEVLNSLNGSDSMKNYVLTLKQMGGVTLSSKLVGSLGLKRNTVSEIESELEKRKVIQSINIAGRKLVFFNHPEFTSLTARELVEKLEESSE
jgi:hypothetical protein